MVEALASLFLNGLLMANYEKLPCNMNLPVGRMVGLIAIYQLFQ